MDKINRQKITYVLQFTKRNEQIIEDLLNSDNVSDDSNSLDKFVENHKLHKTSSLRRLISKVVIDKKAKRNGIIRKMVRGGIAICRSLVLLGTGIIFVPAIHHKVDELFEHLVAVLIGVVTIFLMSITHELTNARKIYRKDSKTEIMEVIIKRG